MHYAIAYYRPHYHIAPHYHTTLIIILLSITLCSHFNLVIMDYSCGLVDATQFLFDSEFELEDSFSDSETSNESIDGQGSDDVDIEDDLDPFMFCCILDNRDILCASLSLCAYFVLLLLYAGSSSP